MKKGGKDVIETKKSLGKWISKTKERTTSIRSL